MSPLTSTLFRSQRSLILLSRLRSSSPFHPLSRSTAYRYASDDAKPTDLADGEGERMDVSRRAQLQAVDFSSLFDEPVVEEVSKKELKKRKEKLAGEGSKVKDIREEGVSGSSGLASRGRSGDSDTPSQHADQLLSTTDETPATIPPSPVTLQHLDEERPSRPTGNPSSSKSTEPKSKSETPEMAEALKRLEDLEALSRRKNLAEEKAMERDREQRVSLKRKSAYPIVNVATRQQYAERNAIGPRERDSGLPKREPIDHRPSITKQLDAEKPTGSTPTKPLEPTLLRSKFLRDRAQAYIDAEEKHSGIALSREDANAFARNHDRHPVAYAKLRQDWVDRHRPGTKILRAPSIRNAPEKVAARNVKEWKRFYDFALPDDIATQMGKLSVEGGPEYIDMRRLWMKRGKDHLLSEAESITDVTTPDQEAKKLTAWFLANHNFRIGLSKAAELNRMKREDPARFELKMEWYTSGASSDSIEQDLSPGVEPLPKTSLQVSSFRQWFQDMFDYSLPPHIATELARLKTQKSPDYPEFRAEWVAKAQAVLPPGHRGLLYTTSDDLSPIGVAHRLTEEMSKKYHHSISYEDALKLAELKSVDKSQFAAQKGKLIRRITSGDAGIVKPVSSAKPRDVTLVDPPSQSRSLQPDTLPSPARTALDDVKDTAAVMVVWDKEKGSTGRRLSPQETRNIPEQPLASPPRKSRSSTMIDKSARVEVKGGQSTAVPTRSSKINPTTSTAAQLAVHELFAIPPAKRSALQSHYIRWVWRASPYNPSYVMTPEQVEKESLYQDADPELLSVHREIDQDSMDSMLSSLNERAAWGDESKVQSSHSEQNKTWKVTPLLAQAGYGALDEAASSVPPGPGAHLELSKTFIWTDKLAFTQFFENIIQAFDRHKHHPIIRVEPAQYILRCTIDIHTHTPKKRRPSMKFLESATGLAGQEPTTSPPLPSPSLQAVDSSNAELSPSAASEPAITEIGKIPSDPAPENTTTPAPTPKGGIQPPPGLTYKDFLLAFEIDRFASSALKSVKEVRQAGTTLRMEAKERQQMKATAPSPDDKKPLTPTERHHQQMLNGPKSKGKQSARNRNRKLRVRAETDVLASDVVLGKPMDSEQQKTSPSTESSARKHSLDSTQEASKHAASVPTPSNTATSSDVTEYATTTSIPSEASLAEDLTLNTHSTPADVIPVEVLMAPVEAEQLESDKSDEWALDDPVEVVREGVKAEEVKVEEANTEDVKAQEVNMEKMEKEEVEEKVPEVENTAMTEQERKSEQDAPEAQNAAWEGVQEAQVDAGMHNERVASVQEGQIDKEVEGEKQTEAEAYKKNGDLAVEKMEEEVKKDGAV